MPPACRKCIDVLRRFFPDWPKPGSCPALLPDPDLLLLDEPYSGFDWETYTHFWAHADELRARGRALVVVSRFLHDRDRFDRICSIAEGRLE